MSKAQSKVLRIACKILQYLGQPSRILQKCCRNKRRIQNLATIVNLGSRQSMRSLKDWKNFQSSCCVLLFSFSSSSNLSCTHWPALTRALMEDGTQQHMFLWILHHERRPNSRKSWCLHSAGILSFPGNSFTLKAFLDPAVSLNTILAKVNWFHRIFEGAFNKYVLT